MTASALAYVENHYCELVSRSGHTFKQWPQLAEELGHTIRCRSAVLDGEICCLDVDGRSNFYPPMFRRDSPYFYALDVVGIDGRDLRPLPLVERKRRLRAIMPTVKSRVVYLDAIEERGTHLYRAACDRDLEGIVGKWGTRQVSDQRAAPIVGEDQESGQVHCWRKQMEALRRVSGPQQLTVG